MTPPFEAGLSILVVEDEPGDFVLIKASLEQAGIAQSGRKDGSEETLLWARTLAEGIVAAKRSRPDIILLDLALPDSAGLATLLTMRAETPGIPIVILTGHDDNQLAFASIEAGAQDYLVKGKIQHDSLARAMRHARARGKRVNGTDTLSEGLGFLQTAEASIRIKGHMDLFAWLQGDVQKFLPHEVLIAAWGDFGANSVSFDVVSRLPELRTESLYSLCKPGSEACRNAARQVAAKPCGTVQFLRLMRDRWHAAGCAPHVSIRTTGDDHLDFIRPPCDDRIARLLGGMRSSLVHGFSDRRGKLECLYVFLSTDDLSDPAFRANLRFFLPYVDHSLRQVTHLPIQIFDDPIPERDDAPNASSRLSSREVEIMKWVGIGKTNYEIGMILNISALTVKNHLQRIFKKLDASNRAQAVERLGRWRHNA